MPQPLSCTIMGDTFPLYSEKPNTGFFDWGLELGKVRAGRQALTAAIQFES